MSYDPYDYDDDERTALYPHTEEDCPWHNSTWEADCEVCPRCHRHFLVMNYSQCYECWQELNEPKPEDEFKELPKDGS
jgi:hypothetical protein